MTTSEEVQGLERELGKIAIKGTIPCWK